MLSIYILGILVLLYLRRLGTLDAKIDHIGFNTAKLVVHTGRLYFLLCYKMTEFH